jgi:hypothetical protein
MAVLTNYVRNGAKRLSYYTHNLPNPYEAPACQGAPETLRASKAR